MDVYLSGRRVRVNDADLLGEGGEARVYRVENLGKQLALKLFHVANPAKFAKVRAFPQGVPKQVIGPLELALAKNAEPVGYVMPLVAQAHDFARLSSRKWREGVVSNAQVVGLFASLHDTLSQLHARQVTVGDLNDGNVVFTAGAREALVIDADSMQFGAHLCAVAHEKFLDPRLYGLDLTKAAQFGPGTDWYSFAVMLFSSLLYVHPFGGTHQKWPTLLRRAEARHSVFRSDVVWPRLAVAVKVLPDDLNHWFQNVFEHDQRHPFPRGLLDLAFTRCQCGLEHARSVCPECRTLGPLVTRQVLRSRGRCVARTVFETPGRVLAAALQGGLRYVFEEQGVSRREDGSVVLEQPAVANTVFAIAGASTWVANPQGGVVRIEHGAVVERAQTSVRSGVAVLAASAFSSYRQEQAWLVDQTQGQRVGQVLEGQTWLWAGDRLALGFYRVGGLTVAFVVRAGKAGLKQLPQVSWRGRVVEADAVFDARHALLTVVSEADGKEVVQRWLFDEAGALLASSSHGARGHAALLGGRVVLATDAGLVALKVEAGVLVEAVQFPDTQPFVSAGDELLPNPDGSISVIGARDIVQLVLT